MSATRPFYGEFGWAYDLLVDDPVEPWVDAVEAALRANALPDRAQLLDAGAGTGRHAAELARRGHAVTLVDASPSLLDQARARLPSARIVHADLTTLRLDTEFDAIVCRGVLNDVLDDEPRAEILGRFAAHLVAGGIVVLDVRDLDATARRYRGGRSSRRIARTPLGELTYDAAGRMDGGLLRVSEHHELRDQSRLKVADHELAMRPWTREEVESRLRAAGFQDVEIVPGVGRETTDRLLCVAVRT